MSTFGYRAPLTLASCADKLYVPLVPDDAKELRCRSGGALFELFSLHILPCLPVARLETAGPVTPLCMGVTVVDSQPNYHLL
jgi:hypothetical protein